MPHPFWRPISSCLRLQTPYGNFSRFGNLPPADVLPLLKEISDLVGEWKPIQELYHPALELAIRFGISVYDGCYLALAFENQASLLTLDKKLQGAAREMGVLLVGVNV